MTECVFCGSEEAYSSQYGTFCIPCATIVGEIVETHFSPGRRNPAGMIPRYSKDAEDDEVESIRIQLLEIEDMDEDELTVEVMANYNNLETRLWELTGDFEAEDFEAITIEFREMPQLSAKDEELAKLIAIYYQEMAELAEAGELTKAIEKEFDEAIENIINQMSPEAQNPWGAETFEAPYVGSDALMDISKNTDLSSFTTSELTKSSAIHGDFDTASLDYSGHQNLEVRCETFDAEYNEEFNVEEGKICSGCQIYGYWDDRQHCPMCRGEYDAETIASPSATIPSWATQSLLVDALVVITGLGLGFFGVRELKKKELAWLVL